MTIILETFHLQISAINRVEIQRGVLMLRMYNVL